MFIMDKRIISEVINENSKPHFMAGSRKQMF
jgi:hypothetical protein